MTKAAKTTLATVGTIGLLLLIYYLMYIYPYPMPRAYPVGCGSLYYGEASKIEAALADHLSEPENKILPTLNELVALGPYALPKDRKFEGNYPEGTHDLRVKLILGDDRHNIKNWKIFVTSTGKSCVKGKILVVQGFDDKGEWVEEWPDE